MRFKKKKRSSHKRSGCEADSGTTGLGGNLPLARPVTLGRRLPRCASGPLPLGAAVRVTGAGPYQDTPRNCASVPLWVLVRHSHCPPTASSLAMGPTEGRARAQRHGVHAGAHRPFPSPRAQVRRHTLESRRCGILCAHCAQKRLPTHPPRLEPVRTRPSSPIRHPL